MSAELWIFSILLRLLLLGVASITSIQYNEHQTDNNHALYELNVFNNTSMMTSIPHFDYKASPKNITVALGATAYLVCCIRNLGKNTVSWIRHRDINLLSVGKLKYTQDQRYQIFHNNINDTWTLKIKQVTMQDEGIFECQISTDKPVGHAIYLTIVEPESTILGESERFANVGSNLNLTCYIKQKQTPTERRRVLMWTLNDQEINHHSPRGGISIITEHNVATVSHLVIKNLTTTDSGEYSCMTSAKSRSNILLHVLHGDTASTEAVMHNKTPTPTTCISWKWHITFTLSIIINSMSNVH